jgi:two-component system, chemotaxis family, sensor kinase CheA
MNDIVKEFIAECNEGMERFDADLLSLEKDSSARTALLPEIFRVVHSIKGACGFLGFPKLESLTHVGENLLSGLSEGKLSPHPEILSSLFRMGDAVRSILRNIETSSREGEPDFEELRKEMASLANGETPKDWSRGATPETAAGSKPSEPFPEGPTAQKETLKEPAAPSTDRTVRVDVDLLDKLMNLVGELVLVRNQVLQWTRQSGDSRLGGAAQQLNLITTELQEGIVKTRMQPVKNVWSKFPRLVRELSIACGKQVRVEMEGEDTELDKSVLEAIKDPLTHVLRNSVDHGIETPDVRQAAGKIAEGRILLKAYQKDGQVNIEIGDDGAGIDPRKVSAKALEKGLVTVEALAKMSDHDLAQLIFLAGFSTAEKITHVSGRGVGMDVVKTNVERIGGSIDVLNVPGRGLTLKIKIPLTLAIIPALIVETSGQRFAVPQINVAEIVRLKESAPDRGIEWIHGTPVYRLRGELIPLIRLGKHLGLSGGEPSGGHERFMAVLQADNRSFGVLVDTVRDTQEILVKPLAKHLKSIVFFAGATIMGDGKVSLILDVPGLAQSCNLSREQDDSDAQAVIGADHGKAHSRLLVVEISDYGPMAIPLGQVSRLEEVPPESVKKMSGLEVVQSRGRIMPILRSADLLSLKSGTEDGPRETPRQTGNLHVVACGEGEVVVGLVVERVLDIVDEPLALLLPAMRPGFRGSAIIMGTPMDIIDLHEFVRLTLPQLTKDAQEA